MTEPADRPLLLDSHAFIWLMTAPRRLPSRALAAIEDTSRRVLLSTASVWEIALKVGRGRWADAAPVIGDIEAALRQVAITSLSVSVAHARAAGLLGWDHRDPFDRMLAAQAVAESAVLVTVDRAFADMPEDVPLATMWD